MDNKYKLSFAKERDIKSWMNLIGLVKFHFPGLDTKDDIENYRKILIKNIKRKTALCVKFKKEIVGILLFSLSSECLSCMAVHPEHRRQGIASRMIEFMIDIFPRNSRITVTTFREGDALEKAPRALYKKMGFKEAELVINFDYPQQKFYYIK